MRRRGFLRILVLTIIFFTIGIIGYISWKKEPVNRLTTNLPSSTPSQQIPGISNWITYSNQKLGISFKYDPYYYIASQWPEQTQSTKQAPIIFTERMNYNSEIIQRCDMNSAPLSNLCLLPGENFGQSDYITETDFGDKDAVVFYVYTGKQTNSTLMVVQTTEKPFIEIAIPVDGMGAQEMADKILSTFKFTE